MNSAILALMIVTAPAELPMDVLSPVVREITESAQTGSLLFSKGDCLAVRIYTNSPYTHVATVVYDDYGNPFVYDSMHGVGVRKLSLQEYLLTQAPDEVQLFHPKRSFKPEEFSCFRDYLESQLGRPYAVKHHLTGQRCEGLHCAEYVTDALVKIDWLKVENSPRVSPASLAEGISLHAVYDFGERIEIPFLMEPISAPAGRCERLWMETKICMLGCTRQMSRWFLCQ